MSRKFFIRRNLAKLMLKAFGWTTAGDPPPSGILVGAPHTSNWDWPATLALTWTSNIQPRLMVKQEIFIPPFSWILKATGAVALDRKNPRETVRQLVEEAKSSDGMFHLALAAEGTRSKGTYWKSGFRRLAIETGMPISLAYVDKTTRTTGWGPTFYPSDDVKADMDIVRSFYADKVGINPELTTPPLLREEVELESGNEQPSA